MLEPVDRQLDIPPYADWRFGRWKGREVATRHLIEERFAALFNRSMCRADAAGWQTVAAIIADKHRKGLQTYLQSFGGPFDIDTLDSWPRSRWCNLAVQLATAHIPGLGFKLLGAYPDRDLPGQSKWGVKADAMHQQNVLAQLARTVGTSDRKSSKIAARTWLESAWDTGQIKQPRMPDVREREIDALEKVIRYRTSGAKPTRYNPSAPTSAKSLKTEALSLLNFVGGDRWSPQRQPPHIQEFTHCNAVHAYIYGVAIDCGVA